MAELKSERVGEKKVMVAIDESENSHYALMWVLDNLKQSLNSPLIIFMATSPANNNFSYAAPLASARLYCPVTSMEFVNSIQEQHKTFTLALLKKAKDICASQGVSAEIITEVGDPGVTICNMAEQLKINLLILGDRGLGKIERAFIGSVSSYCVNNAKCPVLVVKKPQ
ncbi:hypothetical protein PTKIN_Ptkin17bG0065700 [Pterospermum kingtungense]